MSETVAFHKIKVRENSVRRHAEDVEKTGLNFRCDSAGVNIKSATAELAFSVYYNTESRFCQGKTAFFRILNRNRGFSGEYNGKIIVRILVKCKYDIFCKKILDFSVKKWYYKIRFF